MKVRLRKRFAMFTALALAVIMAMPGGYVSAAKVGDRLGSVLFTNIKAYINGNAIPSYNVNNYTCVKAADLKNYGFTVSYDNSARASYITAGDFTKASPMDVPDAVGAKSGTPVGDYVYTDIVCYVNGSKVDSFNINSQLVIFMDSLAPFGNLVYDNGTRSLKLTTKAQSSPSQPSTPVTPSGYNVGGSVTLSDNGGNLTKVNVTIKNASGSIVNAVNASANGGFSFAGVTAGTYTIEAYLDGYKPASLSVTVTSASLSNLNLRLEKTASASTFTVSGVLYRAGTQSGLNGANVALKLTSTGQVMQTATTNAQGAYTLSGVNAGTYFIEFSASGYTSQNTPSFAVAGNVNVNTYTLTSASATQGRFFGTVYASDTSGVLSGARVNLYNSAGTRVNYADTDNYGQFSFSNLAAGQYRVDASKSGYNTNQSAWYTVANNSSASTSLTLTRAAARTYTVSGRVTENNVGVPAYVTLYYSGGAAFGNMPTNSGGDYSFGYVPEGQYYVQAQYTTSNAIVNSSTFSCSGSAANITAPTVNSTTAAPPSPSADKFTVTGYVENQSDNTIRAQVVLYPAYGSGSYTSTQTISPGQTVTFTISNVPAGSYSAELYADGHWIDSDNVYVGSGDYFWLECHQDDVYW